MRCACYKSSLSALQSAEPGRTKVDVGIRCSLYRFALSGELCNALSQRGPCPCSCLCRVLCCTRTQELVETLKVSFENFLRERTS